MSIPTVRIVIDNETASGKRQGWHKLVTDVDKTKRNGYAFGGDFLDEGEHDMVVGDIVVECVPTGSRKNSGKLGIAYRVTADGLDEFARVSDWHKAFLTFRDEVAAELAEEPEHFENPLAGFSVEELRAELERRGE